MGTAIFCFAKIKNSPEDMLLSKKMFSFIVLSAN